MRIISWNVNGLRSVYKKGFLDWLEKSQAEIVCLQETKAKKNQLPAEVIRPFGYLSYFNSAQKKGYSGLVIYTKKRPVLVERKLGLTRFDQEGRILKIRLPHFLVVNIYLPHGGRQKENLSYKLEAYRNLIDELEKIKDRKVILIGDFNVAHTKIDLARPRGNRNNTMFTPEERHQINQIIKLGFIDSFRRFNQKNGHYTWWPYYRNARQRNLGWRLDYAFISKSLASRIKNARILSQVKGSDHCPIEVEI